MSHAVAGSGANPLGVVVDHEGEVYVFWRHLGQRIQPIRDMPIDSTSAVVERVTMNIAIRGRPHMLQFGP
jgi:hypothetical protein